MTATCRFASIFHKLSHNLRSNQSKLLLNNVHRSSFHTSQVLGLREVVEKTEGNVTVIEGRIYESPRKETLLKLNNDHNHADEKCCVMCRLKLKLNYRDVLILSQFVQEDGNVVPRQVSGLCYGQHANMKKLVNQAHRAGLMQNLRPHIYPEEYSQMSDHAWKQFNTYFTEAIDEEFHKLK